MVLLQCSCHTRRVHSRSVFHMVVCSGPAVYTSHAGDAALGPITKCQSADTASAGFPHIITALGSGSYPPERGLPESFIVCATVIFYLLTTKPRHQVPPRTSVKVDREAKFGPRYTSRQKVDVWGGGGPNPVLRSHE